MILKLDLLQNSIDYFENSLEAYIEADENGEYGNYADINKKKRWKVAVVFICQALELIFKYKLQTINEVLVFDIIDANITSGYFKTIDASKTIVRLKNLKELNLSEEEKLFKT